MSPELALWIILLVGVVAWGAGWLAGHWQGVAETERRWSEAVSRAEWYRKHGGN